MQTVQTICTDVGEFPAPPHMAEAAKRVKWRKHDNSWPDMRTKAGKEWVKMFKAFSDEKLKEYLSA
jgi:hypothetical protein